MHLYQHINGHNGHNNIMFKRLCRGPFYFPCTRNLRVKISSHARRGEEVIAWNRNRSFAVKMAHLSSMSKQCSVDSWFSSSLLLTDGSGAYAFSRCTRLPLAHARGDGSPIFFCSQTCLICVSSHVI
jgi:hypothetical protein